MKLASLRKYFLPGKKCGASPCFFMGSNYYYKIRIIYKNSQPPRGRRPPGQGPKVPAVKGKTPLNQRKKEIVHGL
jgi:hypothetical protein